MNVFAICIHKVKDTGLTVKHFHREAIQRGFSSCVYHYLIFKDGTAEQVRSLIEPGHHCPDKMLNKNSLSICLVGSSAKQTASLKLLLAQLHSIYPNAEVIHAS